MTRAEKKKELVKLFLMMGFSLSEVIDEAINFQIDRACEWLKSHMYDDSEYGRLMVEAFKKDMEQ